MAEGKTIESRRGWTRNHHLKLPISWRMAGSGPWRKGHLINASTSGVGLLISEGQLPGVGQEIEVRFRRNTRPLPYRVARAEVRQGILGCRIASVENRRRQSRDCFTEVPVAWRNGTKHSRWRSGWLINTSPSGLALLVRGSPPTAGGQIELARKGIGGRVCCRVVRIEVREPERTVVACGVVFPDDCQAWLAPPRKARDGSRLALRRPGLNAVA
jgi:hypothetical protein